MRYIILLFTFAGTCVFAQPNQFFSRSELGPMGGGSYYIGDLNPNKHFIYSKPAFGLIYRYNLHSRAALRFTGTYLQLTGSDAKASDPFLVNRNLRFNNNIFELAGGIEFNYYNYVMNDDYNPISTYMFVEFAYFNMNPTTSFEGNEIELRPLGTEGQGTNLTEDDFYSRNQFAIPFGLGVKFNLIKRVAMSFEYGLRLTFTDYIDDVSGAYVNNELLAGQNGPLAAALADRTIQPYRSIGSNTGLQRGNPNTRDWYSVFSAMITIQLGKRPICFYK